MWWSNSWNWPAPWMFFGPIMMLVFFAACLAVLYLVLRASARGPQGERALGILKERFARGEIDQAEFEERRRVLLG